MQGMPFDPSHMVVLSLESICFVRPELEASIFYNVANTTNRRMKY